MAKSELDRKGAAADGNVSAKRKREAGQTRDSVGVVNVGAAGNGERAGSSANHGTVFAHARGFLHVMWDDVRVCPVHTRAAVRRDPLVTALFGATARARK